MTATVTPELIADPENADTYGYCIHYGLTVVGIGYEDEINELLTFGHHDPRRVLAAFNAHAREYFGWPNVADNITASASATYPSIRPVYAVFRKPDPEQDDEPGLAWIADWSDPDAPGARPVTVFDIR